MIPARLKLAAGWRQARAAVVALGLSLALWVLFVVVLYPGSAPLWLTVACVVVAVTFCVLAFVEGYRTNPVIDTFEHEGGLVALHWVDREAYDPDGPAKVIALLDSFAAQAVVPDSPLPFGNERDVWRVAWRGYSVTISEHVRDPKTARPVAGWHWRPTREIHVSTSWGDGWLSHMPIEALHALAHASIETGYEGFEPPQKDRSHEPQWVEHYGELGLLPSN